MNKINKVIRIFIAATIFCCLLYPACSGQIVRVGCYHNPPKVGIDENGEPVGFFIDIIKYVAKAENWELEFVNGTWKEGLDRLEAGEIDLMPDVAYTADRARHFSFHEVPALSSWFQVYAYPNSGIKTLLDLDGKKVVVLESSVQQQSFLALAQSFHLKINLIGVPDYHTVFEKVKNREADAAVTNQFFGNNNSRRYGLEDTAIIFSPSALHFATAKDRNLHLLKKIDEHLRLLKQDHQSEYYRSLKRWTSDKVNFQIPREIKIIALILLGFLFISLLGGLWLKHLVNVRTAELHHAVGTQQLMS